MQRHLDSRTQIAFHIVEIIEEGTEVEEEEIIIGVAEVVIITEEGEGIKVAIKEIITKEDIKATIIKEEDTMETINQIITNNSIIHTLRRNIRIKETSMKEDIREIITIIKGTQVQEIIIEITLDIKKVTTKKGVTKGITIEEMIEVAEEDITETTINRTIRIMTKSIE